VRRNPSCLDQASIAPLPRKAALVLRTCPHPRACSVHATPHDISVRPVATMPSAIRKNSGACLTSGTCALDSRKTSRSLRRRMTVHPVAAPAPQPSPTWRHPKALPPTASLTWPCGSWWKMGCPTGQRVGTYGETTASWCPVPRSTTGSRLGKKRRRHAWARPCWTGRWLSCRALSPSTNGPMAVWSKNCNTLAATTFVDEHA